MRWTTRFRSRLPITLAFALGGCVSFSSYGEPAARFDTPAVARAFIPLAGSEHLVLEDHGAAVAIAPGIAVTNAHNSSMIDPKSVLGTSTEYDLLFFSTTAAPATQIAQPTANEKVVAYGEGMDGELRVADGTMLWLDAPVLPRCAACSIQHAFAFEADAGPGFSGGPVLDANSGALVGIVFGYRDVEGRRLMYAYDMALIEKERARLAP